jgi:hypothetical protein
MGGILGIGLPYIESVKDDRDNENVLYQFSSVFDNIKKLATSGQDDVSTVQLNIGVGSLQMKSSDFDRTIVMYSFEDNDGNCIDFSIDGLSDKDNSFQLIMNTPDTIDFAKIYDINENGEREWISDDNIADLEVISPELFEGKKLIELYSPNNYPDHPDPFGKIWLFDSNPIIYTDSDNNDKIILEKSGILHKDSNDFNVRESSLVNAPENTNFIAIHIIQTNVENDKSISSNENNIIKLNLKNELNIRPERSVTIRNLKIQFSNNNAETWKEELLDNHLNTFDNDISSPSIIRYMPSFSTKVHLELMLSVFEIDLS